VSVLPDSSQLRVLMLKSVQVVQVGNRLCRNQPCGVFMKCHWLSEHFSGCLHSCMQLLSHRPPFVEAVGV
jgi:hypothetical protein